MTFRIAWIDADATRAAQAGRALARLQPHWQCVSATADQVQDQDALAHCDALVWWLDARTQADALQALASWSAPALLCLRPDQQALALPALQGTAAGAGARDYLVHRPRQACWAELAQRLALLLARAAPAPVAEQALRQQLRDMHTALASMSQGVLQTDDQGRIIVFNERVLELLELEREQVACRPTLAELTAVQSGRGDFGQQTGWVDERGRDYVGSLGTKASPELYWRTTRGGRTLEVRTKTLDSGALVRTFADVSDFVRVQTELKRSEARFRSLSDLSSDWYWEQDAQLRFTDITGAMAQQDERLRSLLGRHSWEVRTLNMSEQDWAAHRAQLARRESFRDLELRRVGLHGRDYWIALSGVPIVAEDGSLLGYRGVGRNITERKRVEGEVERLAFYDPLTGLPNRRLFLDRLRRACLALQRSQGHAAVLFIDLDNFKDLNDTRGHDMGDHLLMLVSQRLTACLRACDTVARFGGDEFVVLLEQLGPSWDTARAHAEKLAHKIAASLTQPYTLGPQMEHHSTPSIGVTVFGHPCASTQELLKQADFAMYEAKAAGRNTVRFFDPTVLAARSERNQLEVELRQALARGEMALAYQPVVDAQGRVTGAEALLRWNHPTRGLVLPGAFIALAESSDLIIALGRWVLHTACAQLAAWAGEVHLQHLVLSVNVSARQFHRDDFVEQVLEALHQAGASPRQLRLELTESTLLTDTELTIARMQELCRTGVRFSLDDFGTGYSSLSYLKRLPLDQLKIDRSFVRDVLVDANDAAIVRTIIALARSLDLGLVAEGVETRGQLAFLCEHGCQAFQGYLFGKPMALALFEQAAVQLGAGTALVAR